MPSYDTDNIHIPSHERPRPKIIVSRIEDLRAGECKTVALAEGQELVAFNVDGVLYAINNFCPHKGAPLAEGTLCGYVVECNLHGWQFDVRSGECLTVTEQIQTYEVVVEDGFIKVVL